MRVAGAIVGIVAIVLIMRAWRRMAALLREIEAKQEALRQKEEELEKLEAEWARRCRS